MPQYKVTDPQSGRSLLLTGDSPPSEDELNQLFAGQQQASSPVLIKSQSGLQNEDSIRQYNPGFLERVIGMQGMKKLDAAQNALFPQDSVFRDLSVAPPPQTIGQGLKLGVEGLVNSIATPGGILTGAVGGPIAALGRIPALLTVGAGGAMMAPALGQAAGILSPGSGATAPQMAQAAVLPASLALGVAAGVATRERPQVTPQPPRPGTPEYIDYVNKVVNPKISSRSPAKPTPPAATVVSPDSNPATTTPLIPSGNPAQLFQQQMRAQTAKMSVQQLQQAYELSKQTATQHGVAGNLDAAIQEAIKGQFYREQLERIDAQHSLKAAASALKFAQDNKTLSPQEIQQFKQQGDQIFPLVEKNSGQAKQQAQQLYENIRERNAAAGNKKDTEGQASGQEGKNVQKQNAPQEQAQSQVSKGLPGNARGNVGLDVKGTAGVLDDEKLGPRPSRKMDRSWGEQGFVIAPKEMWDSLFNNRSTKIDPEQLYNRLKNKLGEASGTFKALQTAGLSGFLNQPRSVDEVEKWAEEKGPKVEVRKFGEGALSPEQAAYQKITHEWFDSLGRRFQGIVNAHYDRNVTPEMFQHIINRDEKGSGTHSDEDLDRFVAKANEYMALRRKAEAQGNVAEQSHWQFVAPKPEREMPGYVEIAVVKPRGKEIITPHLNPDGTQKAPTQYTDEQDKFPSSHNFPPNTLGFVRGYMETLPNGKKVFHVIEVQSDWVQRVRESKEAANRDTYHEGQASDPLLPHYERLVLKAAIDHARSEGADAIAISDVETAMMTQGHDRLPMQSRDPDGERLITQSPGMRLHYDQTLPKIAGELTGEKGEKVEFGEHKMAWDLPRGNAEHPVEENAGVRRKDLIFRNEKGEPKTDVTARMFPIAKAKKDFSLYGRTGAIFPKPTPRQGPPRTLSQIAQAQQQTLVSKVANAVKATAPEIHSFLSETAKPAGLSLINHLRGNALPYTSGVNQQLGNRLYNYAQAHAVADVLAKIDPDTVLGTKDPTFDKKLGGTLVEYNLQQLGKTSIGKQWSPFKTNKDYQDALKDPQIQAAIQRHNDIVLKDATQRHEELGGEKLKLPDQRMFVNLKFPGSEDLGRGATGNLKATLQKKSITNQERKGTAEEYDTSYRSMAERMIKANYSEFQRKLLNDEYVKQGLGAYVKPGDKIPDFGRHGAMEIPVRLQRAILLKEGESPNIVSQNKSLYIRKDLAPEYMQALGANPSLIGGALRGVASILTKVQVQLGVDTVQHTVNMLSAVDGVTRAQGYKNVIGVKEYDTLKRIVQNIANVQRDDPQTQQLLREMAANYGIARPEHDFQGMFGGKSLGGKAISTVDKAGRLTLFQIAKELAAKGLIKDNEADIRNFVNKNLGQYNIRLQSAFTAFAKSTFSPFIIAGKTFNRLAASRLLLSPGVKAANPQAWATMRARQALYIATGMVVIPALLNYKFNSQAFPEDTKIGEIKLPDGKIIDMGRYTFERRGERITGVGPVIDEQLLPRLRGEQPAAMGQTAADSFTDVARGFAAPYAGPLPNMAASLLTGKTALGYQSAQPGEQYPYTKAAVRQANPILGAGMSDQPTTDFERRLEQITGTRDTTPRSIVNRFRRQFLYKIGKAQQDDFTSGQYIKLTADLLNNNVTDAKKDYQDLLKYEVGQHTDEGDPQHAAQETLQRHFEDYAKSHGQTSKAQEEAFVKTLTPHQKDLYDKALKQQEDVSNLFFSQIQPKMSGNEPRGFRPPTIRRPRHFSY